MTVLDGKRPNIVAYICSRERPSDAQSAKIRDFIARENGAEVSVVWEEHREIGDGFRIEFGEDGRRDKVYDWTLAGKSRKLKADISTALKGRRNVMPLIRQAVGGWEPEPVADEIGTVISVGDGIAVVDGLGSAGYGEILLFDSGIRGMALDLREDDIGCVLFGDSSEVKEGSTVLRSGRVAGMPVGEAYIGRAVNALGEPIDGKGSIAEEDWYPIESPAPAIIDRKPVSRPLETGLLAVDSMFPIGRGQRELIIGDRQTGKTALAVDTILNQKGRGVICIYAAIGQKGSSVAQLADVLEKRGAMDYTVIVSSTASEAATMQYITPYAACALGEYFMRRGKDVLIVYDDLSKHAVAYRALSLLLGRSPGREAYPGDVFYLHSRLLERSAQLADRLGGGSMTALPIVETQAGDVAAYIPTNIISITDGQLFLESDLFHSGQRPAVNIGLSVSRVGGAAQAPAMKKAAGSIRLDLAQYREIEVFTQFASDLDELTKRQLRYGHGLMQLLRQPQYHPYSRHAQVILLTAALDHAFEEAEPGEIAHLAAKLIAAAEAELPDICAAIDGSGTIADSDRRSISALARRCASPAEPAE